KNGELNADAADRADARATAKAHLPNPSPTRPTIQFTQQLILGVRHESLDAADPKEQLWLWLQFYLWLLLSLPLPLPLLQHPLDPPHPRSTLRS
ncbi:MAG: hypothetical protein ACJ79A_20375, partial [Gemmatimonadaceae bacterium]